MLGDERGLGKRVVALGLAAMLRGPGLGALLGLDGATRAESGGGRPLLPGPAWLGEGILVVCPAATAWRWRCDVLRWMPGAEITWVRREMKQMKRKSMTSRGGRGTMRLTMCTSGSLGEPAVREWVQSQQWRLVMSDATLGGVVLSGTHVGGMPSSRPGASSSMSSSSSFVSRAEADGEAAGAEESKGMDEGALESKEGEGRPGDEVEEGEGGGFESKKSREDSSSGSLPSDAQACFGSAQEALEQDLVEPWAPLPWEVLAGVPSFARLVVTNRLLPTSSALASQLAMYLAPRALCSLAEASVVAAAVQKPGVAALAAHPGTAVGGKSVPMADGSADAGGAASAPSSAAAVTTIPVQVPMLAGAGKSVPGMPAAAVADAILTPEERLAQAGEAGGRRLRDAVLPLVLRRQVCDEGV